MAGRSKSPKPVAFATSSAGRGAEHGTTLLGKVRASVPPPPPPVAEWQKRDAGKRARRGGREARRLGTAEEVPAYQRVPYICSGYRLERPALCHFWCLHNETGNMWTHALASVCAAVRLALWLRSLFSDHPDALTLVEARGLYALCISLYMVGSVMIFWVSVQYHWRKCAGQAEVERWLCLDLSGCAGLVAFGHLAGIPMGFHCFPRLRAGYVAMSIGVLACVVLAKALRGRIRSLQSIPTKFVLFFASLSAILPALHWLWVSAEGRQAAGSLLAWAIVLGVAASAVYTRHFPECFAPGRFDLVGHSHQIWHVLGFLVVMIYGECLVSVFVLARPEGPGSRYCGTGLG